ncbi:MAG: hypothetical protein BWY87_00329 [Deltaproteobacteria bacterium ADurb.Bin510]|nr:MAG: hypothetical protein BWY87_00329 [Deltaproteobacteria bacterium ADurb.Bin510]
MKLVSFALALLLALSACAELPRDFEAWPQAQQAFRQDALWHGGDGAASVRLAQGRELWLFGDSFIGASRPQAEVVRNSLGLQRGDAPLEFCWQPGPKAFFGGGAGAWLWPGSGLMLDKWLLIFMLEVQPAENELGFRVGGARAIMITNPAAAPQDWRQYRLRLPQDTAGIVLGSGSLVVQDGYLFALSAERDSRAAHLVRWPLEQAKRGDLRKPQYYDGSSWQFNPARSRPIFADAQIEYGVARTRRGWVAIHTRALDDPAIVMRTSPSLLGPWSEPQVIYQPPEARVAGNLVYAAKPHPELGGRRLVVSYAVNASDFERLLNDASLYYPLLIRSRPYRKPR